MNDSMLARANAHILANYKRFPIMFKYGRGNYLYDSNNEEYLDFGGGIAVNTLGHAHPDLLESITNQIKKTIHISNYFYSEPLLDLAETINSYLNDSGKVFFSNSGTEANECLIKLARKFGNQNNRNEIITTTNSFHGRTYGGMSATGQDKIKKGFEPLLQGFKHVGYNNIEEIKNAITDKTCAILIEGIQGEGGIVPASPEFLLELRKLCFENNILLLFDAIQCGYFRSGCFQSYERILENRNHDFKPDGISMAKSLGGGLPIGAVWISNKYANILDAGSHGTTFGGNPLVCAVANKIFEIIKRDNLAELVRKNGDYLKENLVSLKSEKIKEVRGFGYILGIELQNIAIPDEFKDLTPAGYICTKLLNEEKLITIPAGTKTIRLLPALNTEKADIDKALGKIESLLKKI